MFDIPIVLFIFKREETTLKILERLKQLKPQKMYLLSDGGRTKKEKADIAKLRENIESAIDWDCTLVKKYAAENVGVFENIGLGAKWVLQQEKYAIFIEDDNLPESTFFQYCEELLKRYEDNDEVLWICGSNYLGKLKQNYKEDYCFTRNLLPCGWASWGSKFLKYYDENFEKIDEKLTKKNIKKTYIHSSLYHQQLSNFIDEVVRNRNGKRYASWDYQMEYSIRKNNKVGIMPKYNQIRNIGADENSIHGGTSLAQVMSSRFCERPTYPLEFPLHHPQKVEIIPEIEKEIEKIILYPLKLRMKSSAIRRIKMILGIDNDEPIRAAVKNMHCRLVKK